MHAGDVVHRDNFGTGNELAGRVKDQAVDIPVGRLSNSGESKQHEATKGEGNPGEAHTDSPASNESQPLLSCSQEAPPFLSTEIDSRTNRRKTGLRDGWD